MVEKREALCYNVDCCRKDRSGSIEKLTDTERYEI